MPRNNVILLKCLNWVKQTFTFFWDLWPSVSRWLIWETVLLKDLFNGKLQMMSTVSGLMTMPVRIVFFLLNKNKRLWASPISHTRWDVMTFLFLNFCGIKGSPQDDQTANARDLPLKPHRSAEISESPKWLGKRLHFSTKKNVDLYMLSF